jgi:hypothetical protein
MLTPDALTPDMIMNLQIGHMCSKWSFLEYSLETIIWWELNIDPWNGRAITGTLNINRRVDLAHDLLNLRSFDYDQWVILGTVEKHINRMEEERNLGVHGTRFSKENQTYGVISRGKMRYDPQQISFNRLRNLTDAITYSVTYLQHGIMLKHGLVNPAYVQPLPDTLPLLLTPDFDPRKEARE